MSSVCKSCGAAIVWASTPKGETVPVDATPSAGGTIELSYAGKSVTAITHAGSNGTASGGLHASHFETCPFAKRGRP